MPYTVEILRRAAKTLRSLTDRKLYHRLRKTIDALAVEAPASRLQQTQRHPRYLPRARRRPSHRLPSHGPSPSGLGRRYRSSPRDLSLLTDGLPAPVFRSLSFQVSGFILSRSALLPTPSSQIV
jgi:hypothetical protein